MSEGLLWALGEADANVYLCSKELRPSEQKLYIITFISSVLTDWLAVFIRLKTHTMKHKGSKKQQRQAVREARIPINAGRLYN